MCLFERLVPLWIVGRSRSGITTRLVLLNKRGRNGCGRAGATVVDDGGSVAGSVVGSKIENIQYLSSII